MIAGIEAITCDIGSGIVFLYRDAPSYLSPMQERGTSMSETLKHTDRAIYRSSGFELKSARAHVTRFSKMENAVPTHRVKLRTTLKHRLATVGFTALFLGGWYLHLTSPGSVKMARSGNPLRSADMVVWPARHPDVLTLAKPSVARQLNITPINYSKIVRIDSELDRSARATVEEEVRHWQSRGGFHIEPMPNFRDPETPCGHKLVELRQRAEERILSVLSESEKQRWRDQKPRMRTLRLPEDQEVQQTL